MFNSFIFLIIIITCKLHFNLHFQILIDLKSYMLVIIIFLNKLFF